MKREDGEDEDEDEERGRGARSEECVVDGTAGEDVDESVGESGVSRLLRSKTD